MAERKPASRVKAEKLDDETTELEEAAHKVSKDAADLKEEVADKQPSRKAEPEKKAAPEKKATPKQPVTGQRPEKPGAPSTRQATPTAPTVSKASAEVTSSPVPSVTHPPGADER